MTDVSAAWIDTVAKDLHQLRFVCEAPSSKMGRPMLIQGNEFPDIWHGVEYLTSLVLEKSPSSDLASLKAVIDQLQGLIISLQSFGTVVTECETTLATHSERFKFIHPMLMLINQLGPQVASLLTRCETLEHQLQTIESAVPHTNPP
jgi:hypothetical protein